MVYKERNEQKKVSVRFQVLEGNQVKERRKMSKQVRALLKKREVIKNELRKMGIHQGIIPGQYRSLELMLKTTEYRINSIMRQNLRVGHQRLQTQKNLHRRRGRRTRRPRIWNSGTGRGKTANEVVEPLVELRKKETVPQQQIKQEPTYDSNLSDTETPPNRQM